jgi:hypothetical protein
MKTFNRFKQDILVWSIILGIFSVLTLIAVNYPRIRSSIENRYEQKSGEIQIRKLLAQTQPGYTAIAINRFI